MAVPAQDERIIREWTGRFDPGPDNDLYLEVGSGYLVALSVLRTRLAELTCDPAQSSTDGDYSEDYTKTIELLERQIARLEQVITDLDLDDAGGHALTIKQVTAGGARIR